jgi:hypothetical protein
LSSASPQFIDKVRDIVGLYLNPPQAALVRCVDEKTQVQALDRTAPVLPLLPGTPQRATHNYTRHGTTNLYAALDVASGKVITDLTGRHRAIEFRRFLARIDQAVPAELAVHVICDNSSTHKTPAIQLNASTRPVTMVKASSRGGRGPCSRRRRAPSSATHLSVLCSAS